VKNSFVSVDGTPESFAEALTSGDTDRADHYLALFDACAPVFESDDGSVRQYD